MNCGWLEVKAPLRSYSIGDYFTKWRKQGLERLSKSSATSWLYFHPFHKAFHMQRIGGACELCMKEKMGARQEVSRCRVLGFPGNGPWGPRTDSAQSCVCFAAHFNPRVHQLECWKWCRPSVLWQICPWGPQPPALFCGWWRWWLGWWAFNSFRESLLSFSPPF